MTALVPVAFRAGRRSFADDRSRPHSRVRKELLTNLLHDTRSSLATPLAHITSCTNRIRHHARPKHLKHPKHQDKRCHIPAPELYAKVQEGWQEGSIRLDRSFVGDGLRVERNYPRKRVIVRRGRFLLFQAGKRRLGIAGGISHSKAVVVPHQRKECGTCRLGRRLPLVQPH
jgi:hypothetical protein